MKTLAELDAQLNKMSIEVQKTNKVKKHDYFLYYDLIQSGAFQKVCKKFDESFFAEIKKMQKNDFAGDNLKSFEPAKKKLRDFFQKLGKGTNMLEAERKKLQSDTLALMLEYHAVLTAKRDK